MWDFMCIDTYVKSNIQQTRRLAGTAAEAAVHRNHPKHSRIKGSGLNLIVLAVETAGMM